MLFVFRVLYASSEKISCSCIEIIDRSAPPTPPLTGPCHVANADQPSLRTKKESDPQLWMFILSAYASMYWIHTQPGTTSTGNSYHIIEGGSAGYEEA